MTPIRWTLLVAPAVLIAACSGGASHHSAASPATGSSSATSVRPSPTPTITPTTTASSIATVAPPTTSPPAPTTEIVRVSPVDSTGRLKSGYSVTSTQTGTSCVAGSDTGANAYRCFSGHGVYDPCWLDTDDGTNHTVACISQPWSTQVTRITVPQFVGTFGSPVTDAPLALQLSDGERCGALQGAHDAFNGRIIDFACDQRAVLRPLHTQSPLWTADTATNAPGTAARYAPGPTMTVTTAWVAAPSLTAASSQ